MAEKLREQEGVQAPEVAPASQETKELERVVAPTVAPEDYIDEVREDIPDVDPFAPSEHWMDVTPLEAKAEELRAAQEPQQKAPSDATASLEEVKAAVKEAIASAPAPVAEVHVEAPSAEVERKIEAVDERRARNSRFATKRSIIIAAVAAIAVVCGLVAWVMAAANGSSLDAFRDQMMSTHEQQASDMASLQSGVDDMSTTHKHDWTIATDTITHEEVSHTVDHPAVYEDVTEYHTVCNQCHEAIDGVAAQHIAETGHSGYSRNVPVTVPTLVSAAWVETVVDEAAWTETVADHMVCADCGETKPLDEASGD